MFEENRNLVRYSCSLRNSLWTLKALVGLFISQMRWQIYLNRLTDTHAHNRNFHAFFTTGYAGDRRQECLLVLIIEVYGNHVEEIRLVTYMLPLMMRFLPSFNRRGSIVPSLLRGLLSKVISSINPSCSMLT